jgi:uncharacterized protein (DUF3084 family)
VLYSIYNYSFEDLLLFNSDEFRRELRVNNIDLDTGEEEWTQVVVDRNTITDDHDATTDES